MFILLLEIDGGCGCSNVKTKVLAASEELTKLAVVRDKMIEDDAIVCANYNQSVAAYQRTKYDWANEQRDRINFENARKAWPGSDDEELVLKIGFAFLAFEDSDFTGNIPLFSGAQGTWSYDQLFSSPNKARPPRYEFAKPGMNLSIHNFEIKEVEVL